MVLIAEWYNEVTVIGFDELLYTFQVRCNRILKLRSTHEPRFPTQLDTDLVKFCQSFLAPVDIR